MLSLAQTTRLLVKHYNQQLNKWGVTNEGDKFLTHKIRHSYSVYATSQRIMIQNRFLGDMVSDKLQHRVQVACILHDIARLYQINEEGIISNKVFEHGDAAYAILLKENVEDKGVLLAVKYHNKKNYTPIFDDEVFQAMSEEEKEETLYLSKMVRDADKLENMEYIVYNENKDFAKWESKVVGTKIENDGISPLCMEELRQGELVSNKNVSTRADQILAKLAWVLDINFEGTRKLINDSKYKEFMLGKLAEFGVSKEEQDEILNILP